MTTMLQDLPEVDERSAVEVLYAARDAQRAARLAEVAVLKAAYEWAVLHACEREDEMAAGFFDRQTGWIEPIVGVGAPSINEYAVPEFGAVLGISTDQAKRLIGHAVELHHRLPRIWARLQDGQADVFRARNVAEATIHSFNSDTAAGAVAWVDRAIAPILGKVSATRIALVVSEAQSRFGLLNPADVQPANTRVDIDLGMISDEGTTLMQAELDLADAIDLEAALQHGAAALKAAGSAATLDQRCATALGDIARGQTALRLWDPIDVTGPGRSAVESMARAYAEGAVPTDVPVDVPAMFGRPRLDKLGNRLPELGALSAARAVELNLHFDAAALPDGAVVVDEHGRLVKGNHHVMFTWIKRWAEATFTEVKVRPILDLNQPIASTGYKPSPTLAAQIKLRDRTCVFPHCERAAEYVDLDHIVPFDPDRPASAQTHTRNLACLCRRHHRLKTHTAWRYQMTKLGTFEWTSPRGLRWIRHPDGTTTHEGSHEVTHQPDDGPGDPSLA